MNRKRRFVKGTRDLVGIIRVGNGLGRSRSEGRTERENEQKSGRKVRNGRDSDGSGCDPRTVHGVVDTFVKCWEQPPPHLDQTFPHQYFLYRPTPPISKKSHGKPSITIPQPTITNGKPRKGKGQDRNSLENHQFHTRPARRIRTIRILRRIFPVLVDTIPAVIALVVDVLDVDGLAARGC